MVNIMKMNWISYESCLFLRIESYFIELRVNKPPP